MNYCKLLGVLVMASTVTPVAFADDIAYGGIFSNSFYAVDDTGGNTDAENISAYGVMIALPYTRDVRFLMGVRQFSDTKYSASSPSDIGLEASRTLMIEASMQKRFRLTEFVKPFLGVGVVYGQDEFTNRFTIDEDGFLADELDDREESSLALQLSLSQEWEINDSFMAGVHSSYEFLGSDTFEGFSIGLTVFYK